MKLRPCLDESSLLLREGSRNELNRVDPEHRNRILIVRMEVRCLVGGPASANFLMMIPKKREISGTRHLYGFQR